jgi:2-oxoglutarate ferredoxin oxidoreductase subunit alpha
VPELNSGQLTRLVRSEYLVDAKVFSKVVGLPFVAREIEAEIERILDA